MSHDSSQFTPVRVSTLAKSIQSKLSQSIGAISAVNGDLRLLAFNAKIQAAKAGDAGAGFGVVANEIKDLVTKTQGITEDLENRVGHTIDELMTLNELLETQVRGRRLAQVAGNCIDIVDRNLYERSCDVRWWATESAVVEALELRSEQAYRHADARLATILRSYTVYYDLVLCDLEGRIVSNGRPDRFACAGADMSRSEWFLAAKRSIDGDVYGFQGPCRSVLAGGEPVLVYSCGVRAGGASDGRLLGVLGIVFNWEALGRVVVERAERTLCAECAHPLNVYICLPGGEVVASTDEGRMGKMVPVPDLRKLQNAPDRFFAVSDAQGGSRLFALAPSLGFETYKTGWCAIVVEDRSRPVVN